jgi:DNA-binding IscR family transcriptional regulator
MQRMQPVSIALPKKPRIKQKEQQPDQRQFSIVPIRAITDRRLTGMEMRVLMMYCCYTNRSGLTWVGQQRIATHLNVSKMRVSVLTTALVNKGYLKVVYQGFRGERADTRQVIYKAELDLADIVAVTNEPAPYMIEQQQKIQLNQPVKGQRMAKRKAVKVNDQVITDLELNDSDSHLGLDCQLEAIRKAVGSEILAAAQQQAGPAATVADIEAMLSKMLT